ncbi:polyADP-ribosyltransferase [Heterostelium album PN500]|uniref:Poly [ADP-ribose] polymerase n=1 Tax=Heterostelium pallidum (strain ATCC 26659 / Pp 5 / PN500) TaxID=670386 RepID=D3BQX9_HETP5|nr:polyADP-ribosyltransferase [Heterostelium album PN500]EFA76165.1 polyADP-ribosyltransferase [Heterostelium album PN500]|eukprot:XP_020428299.1 polyADP-ribosyltransferase [Heterostelium album PN500]
MNSNNSNNNSLFKGLVFMTLGKTSVPSYQLTDLIKSKSGDTSFTLTSKVNYVLTNSVDSIVASKLKQIQQLSIPILNDSFVIECCKTNSLINISSYQLNSVQQQQSTSLTSLSVSISEKKNECLTSSSSSSNLSYNNDYKIIPDVLHIQGINIYNEKDKQPSFTNEFNILTSHLLQNTSLVNRNNVNKFFYLELQFDKDQSITRPYRIYTQFGRTDKLDQSTKQHRYFETKEEAMRVYSSIYNVKTSEENGYQLVNVVESNIGSDRKLALSNTKNSVATHFDEDIENNTLRTYISKDVSNLVERIYSEASKSLSKSNYSVHITKQGLSTALGVLTLKQLESGAAILKSINELLFQNNGKIIPDSSDYKRLEDLCSNYYSIVPTKIGNKASDKSKAIITTYESHDEHEEMLQLMIDLSKVGSQNNQDFVSSSVSDMRYNALNATIHHLHADSSEYNMVLRSMIHLTPKQDSIQVVNIYRVQRDADEQSFKAYQDLESIGNEQFLFHATKSSNLLGVLSRGLQLPDVVVKRGFSKRTDRGFLGHGIYFSKTLEGSLNYTCPYSGSSTRSIFIASVALGKSSIQTKIDPHISQAPKGFNSCHGVPKSSTNADSPFTHDEYVIYNRSQQKLSYLVEFNYKY